MTSRRRRGLEIPSLSPSHRSGCTPDAVLAAPTIHSTRTQLMRERSSRPRPPTQSWRITISQRRRGRRARHAQQALDKAQAGSRFSTTRPSRCLGAIGGRRPAGAFLARLDAGRRFSSARPERALRAMAHLTTYGRALRRWETRARPREASAVAPPASGCRYVAKPWLAAAKIPVPRDRWRAARLSGRYCVVARISWR